MLHVLVQLPYPNINTSHKLISFFFKFQIRLPCHLDMLKEISTGLSFLPYGVYGMERNLFRIDCTMAHLVLTFDDCDAGDLIF